MIRERTCVAVAAVVTAAVLLSAQEPPGRFAYERTATAAVTGPQRLPIDEALLVGGKPFFIHPRGETKFGDGGLADLRLFEASGRPVPYLLVHARPPEPRWQLGVVLALTPTKTTSGFEVDFRRAQPIDTLRIDGIPAPFLKRLFVEGSGDRTRWTALAPEATLFDLPEEGLRQLDVGFTAGEYRYVRVTWNDTNSGAVPAPRLVRARAASRASVVPPPPMNLTFERQASEPGRSRYRIRLPGARLPIVAVELEVGGGHVFRTAVVMESRFTNSEAEPKELGRATLRRVVRDGVDAANLGIPIASPVETELQLIIEDGSNTPLDVKKVMGRLAQLPAIYFEASAGTLVARYGDKTLPAPKYDLEAVRDSIDISRVPEARWNNPKSLVETEPPPPQDSGLLPGALIDPSGFKYTRAIENKGAGLCALPLDAAVLAHSSGPSQRFPDVRILDEANRQIPYLLERRDEPLQVDLTVVPAESAAPELKRAPGRLLSVYKIALPYNELPPSMLVLDTSARVFQRNVQLGIERPADRRRREPWFQAISSATWLHADKETAARPLSLRVDRDNKELVLAVDEGDNAPLPITGARLLLPSYRLRFYHPGNGTLRLAYGRDDLHLPRYDLTLLAQQVMGAPAREVAVAASTSKPGSAGERSFVSPLTFWILLGSAVLVLVGLIARLVRQER